MIARILAFLRLYVAYYTCAVLGGFSVLWLQSQGLFSLGTIGYAAAIVFMPAVIKSLKTGESFVETWQNINKLIDRFQDGQLNPAIDKLQIEGTELAAKIDELLNEKINKIDQIVDEKINKKIKVEEPAAGGK